MGSTDEIETLVIDENGESEAGVEDEWEVKKLVMNLKEM